MMWNSVLWLLLLAGCAVNVRAEEPRPLAERQQEFLSWRFGMFLHFNMATFNDEEWAMGHENPGSFIPRKLDCGQWADAAKAAGMQYAVLTVKHTGGWCLWDSKLTDHDITAFNNYTQGDIVRQFVDAFRERGLKVGFYYCAPGDFSGRYGNRLPPGKADLHGLPPEAEGDYAGFMMKQFDELLTDYGPIDLLWIDQYNNKYTRNQWEQIKAHIASLQPNCLVIANNSLKWQETDIHSYEYPYLKTKMPSRKLPPPNNANPAEVCDTICDGWFWHRNSSETSVREAADIVQMVKLCNERHANYLLNVPPDDKGLLPKVFVERLEEVGKMLAAE